MKPGDLVIHKADPHFAFMTARERFGLGTVVKLEPIGAEHPGQPWYVHVLWTGTQAISTESKSRLEVVTNV